jgi:TnpA family transposase
MPRKAVLSAAQQTALVALPSAEHDLRLHYTLSENDLAIIRSKRGPHNRLGFAIQLCYLRFPGQAITLDANPSAELLAHVAQQIKVSPEAWTEYAARDETRREHALELQSVFGYRPFTIAEYRRLRGWLTNLALQTNKPLALAEQLIESLRSQRVIVPAVTMIDRLCAEALARGVKLLYQLLTQSLDEDGSAKLDALLLPREDLRTVVLTWLRQPPGEPKARNVLAHLDRLHRIREVMLPANLGQAIHEGRLAQLAREGAQMSAQHLRDLENRRRRATLIAVVLDTEATITDQILDMHDRIVGRIFNGAKRKHEQSFAESGKAINEKVRLYVRVGHALIDARQKGHDPYAAIEAVVAWDCFTQSVDEAERLAEPESFDYLHLLTESYGQLRRYAPTLLEIFDFCAAPAVAPLLAAIDTLRAMNRRNARKVPDDAPMGFLRPRWKPYVLTEDGADRPFYEMAVLTELKNGLRAGDVWVPGSRQFKDFEAYLLERERFAKLQDTQALPVAIEVDSERYLQTRLALVQEKLHQVDRLAGQGELPDAEITDELLKVSPLKKAVPEQAEQLEEEAFALMPHLKITELLLEVDQWTDFTRHFTHLRSGELARDRAILLTVILADAINLGLAKMAEACPGTTFHKLDSLRAWRRLTPKPSPKSSIASIAYPFPANWGPGTTSSSDGQYFHVGGRGEHAGQVNARYGSGPGVTFYTHISDRYAPFHTKVINATVRDATHVLDGLLYHESDLRIEEHYTDTAGFTDHVFGLCHLLGFRFAPRIRDLADRRLYTAEKAKRYPALQPFIGGTINLKQLLAQWSEILRLGCSIRLGTVTSSLILRKLASYPRQNALALGLREFGRIERTLFTLDWLLDKDLRQRVTAGLNKGELKNSLAKAVCFNRLGELRDRSFEAQRHRASGLNLVVSAIILWNTVYLERAIGALRQRGRQLDEGLLKHVAPVHWNHINLTGDYSWRQNKRVEKGGFRPLRISAEP